jgi:hypothetical protein
MRESLRRLATERRQAGIERDQAYRKNREREAMTEEELAVLRLKVRIVALEALVHTLCSGMARTLPDAHQGMRDLFQRFRQDHSQIALKGVAPEYSDLVAGEYQEELDEVLKNAERYFRK